MNFKRLMQTFAVLLLFVAMTHGQAVTVGKFQDITWNPRGGTIGGVLVRVYPISAWNATTQTCDPNATLSTLYTDYFGEVWRSQSGQPLYSDSVGNFGFYARPGFYCVSFAVSGYLPFAYPALVPMPNLGVGHAGTIAGRRPDLNFVDTGTVKFTVADDATNQKIDVSAVAAVQSLTPAPPYAVPAGQAVAWALPTSSSGSGTSSTGYALASGVLHMTRGCGLCDTFSVGWSGFQMPTLPADAVIQNIYPVQIVQRTGVNGDTTAVYEAKCGTTSLTNNWSQYLMAGKFTSSSSMGNTAATVTSANCWSGFQQSGAYSFDDTAVISFFGLAIYYTTATPYSQAEIHFPEPARVIDGIDAHSLTPTYLSSSANRRTCEIEVGSGAAAVVSGDYAPFKAKSCKIPATSTLVEIAIQSDAGTPSVVIERRRGASTIADLLSGALSGGATPTCARGGTSQSCIDGATSSSSIVLANVALNGGDVIEVKNGTAAGENRARITAIYEIN